jgi:glycosyltransferase involved in cell wall biosynthesis
MLIAFTHAFKAFLPEIEAYRLFFEGYGIKTTVVRTNEINNTKADVEWRFMGLQTRRGKAKVLVHEYASASLPPWRNAKDQIKKRFTVKPDYRLFLNRYVYDQLSFQDQIPYGFRDMGIYPVKEDASAGKKIYDFIYVGSVSKDMQMEKLFDQFNRPGLKDKSLLVLSKNYGHLQEQYNHIIFMGPIEPNEVCHYIQQSAFAINYKPDIAPHNTQTSTKFLEYAACKTPVITTDFLWMRQFQEQYGGNYFYLSKDLSNLDWEAVNNFQYSSPGLSEWTWERQIKKSGVLEFLEGKFGRLGF